MANLLIAFYPTLFVLVFVYSCVFSPAGKYPSHTSILPLFIYGTGKSQYRYVGMTVIETWNI